jgi:hypothetical protein
VCRLEAREPAGVRLGGGGSAVCAEKVAIGTEVYAIPGRLSFYLLFFLIATVGGGLVAMVFGSFVAAFLGVGGMPLAQMNRPLKILGIVIGIPISYVTFRAVVEYLFPKIEEDSPPKDLTNR